MLLYYTYRYDLVDLTRQALAKYANQLFLEIIKAYQSNDVNGVTRRSQTFLELVEDIDTLLACHDGFLLGPWLESAKKLAQNEEQEKQVFVLLGFSHPNKCLLINMQVLINFFNLIFQLTMQFEWNARTQITMWFDNSDGEASLLRDYGTIRTSN